MVLMITVEIISKKNDCLAIFFKDGQTTLVMNSIKIIGEKIDIPDMKSLSSEKSQIKHLQENGQYSD